MSLHVTDDTVKPLSIRDRANHQNQSMAEKRIKTAQVNLRLEPSLKAAAEKAAAADRRSLTSYIEMLIVGDLEAKKGAATALSAGKKKPR
jgi:hypothetical protein